MKQELYLKTVFYCMACDGEIATEEVDLIRNEVAYEPLREGLDVDSHFRYRFPSTFQLSYYLGVLNEKPIP